MSCSEWKEYSLGYICAYRKQKISIENINVDNYISTENMLQDKKGITVANSIPNAKNVDSYLNSDVLISNIRPYFKKIWYADKNGGSSSDVLIFYSLDKDILDSKYLYYLLSSDDFFDYVMSTSKGTKMPRGDKEAIMKYKVELPPVEEQEKIAAILSSLDNKIELNNEMNKTLEEMAQSIFKRWFVDFEFPNEDGQPYKSSGGEMVESELGMIPKGWAVKELGSICEVKGGKRLPKGMSVVDYKTLYPYLRVTDVTNGYVNMNSIKYIDEQTHEKISRYIIEYNDLYISIAGTIGLVGGINKKLDKANLTENMARIICNNINKNYIRLYLNSEEIQNIIKSKAVGSTQPKLPLYVVKGIQILIPKKSLLDEFINIVDYIYLSTEKNLINNDILEEIRDNLLEKLLSGKIEIK